MSNSQSQRHETSGSQIREGRVVGGQVLAYRMKDEVQQLGKDQGQLSGGRAAKTLAKEGTLRVTLVHADAGTTIRPSANGGEASLQVLEGRIRVQVDGHQAEAGPGDLLILPSNLRQPIEAIQDTSFLVTVAWQEGAGAWDVESAQGRT